MNSSICRLFWSFLHGFSSYVVGMSIEKMWRNDEMTNFGIFFEVQTETAKTVQRQLHILHNISKFHHFVISSHLFYWHANHINQQKLSSFDPTHPTLCWRNTWMVPKHGNSFSWSILTWSGCFCRKGKDPVWCICIQKTMPEPKACNRNSEMGHDYIWDSTFFSAKRWTLPKNPYCRKTPLP